MGFNGAEAPAVLSSKSGLQLRYWQALNIGSQSWSRLEVRIQSFLDHARSVCISYSSSCPVRHLWKVAWDCAGLAVEASGRFFLVFLSARRGQDDQRAHDDETPKETVTFSMVFNIMLTAGGRRQTARSCGWNRNDIRADDGEQQKAIDISDRKEGRPWMLANVPAASLRFGRSKQDVQAPRGPRLRTFLFQMFCVAEWDRRLRSSRRPRA
jgi:hypothetical protein